MAVAGCGLLAGCGDVIPQLSEDDTATVTANIKPKKYDDFKPNAISGVRVDPSADPNAYKNFIAMKDFGLRQDPFALLASEQKFDRAQLAERLTTEAGWSIRFEPKPEEPAVLPEEPQPYRRLSGVLIGQTIMALINMEDGMVHVVRPGMKVPNSEWTVVSIDEEKAILKREGNKRPSTIIVRLEVDAGGGGGAPPGGPGGPPAGPGRGGRGGRGGPDGAGAGSGENK
jgi:hypothetical protein